MAFQGGLFTFYTLTPLHAGSGDAADIIDLPVQREKHTQYPEVYSSSLKGSLRYFYECCIKNKDEVGGIFGEEGEKGAAGGVIFTDARILFFPVRSDHDVFKWITCPFVLERLNRDLGFLDNGASVDTSKFSVSDDADGLSFDGKSREVLLEDFPIRLRNSGTVEDLKKFLSGDTAANEKVLKERLVIVSDNVFKTLVSTATQVIARNVLNDKTKISENLWYEEVVPADSIF